jgi:RimJ/RimL family protein N-acetyltransferase
LQAPREQLRAEPIDTDRLVLEPLDVGHAMEMAVVLDSPALHRFTGGGPPASAAELRTRYERLSAGSPDALIDWLNWALRLRETGALAGTVQATVSHTGPALIAQVAWVIGVPWQRRGLATEAARAMVAWLEDKQVAVIVAHIHPDHGASAKVARDAGLVPTSETHRGETVWRRACPAQRTAHE